MNWDVAKDRYVLSLSSVLDRLSVLLVLLRCCCCQSHKRGTAERNEQDYQGRLAGIVWYQRKSSQRGIFRQHSRSFIHFLRAQSDSAHSPAVKPCHYPLVCFYSPGTAHCYGCHVWGACVCALWTGVCCVGMHVCVCLCVQCISESLNTHLRLMFALQAAALIVVSVIKPC